MLADAIGGVDWYFNGLLGDGTTNISASPKQIGTGYTAISAGGDSMFAIKSDGELYAWGLNVTGSLGDGTLANSLSPKLIGSGYLAISSGSYHTVAIKRDGSLWAWGWNTYGMFGDGTKIDSNVPRRIGSNYSQISAGVGFTLGIRADGTLWAWGRNNVGQLGNGTGVDSPIPVYVGSGYSKVSAGGSHVLALKSDGSIWAWGGNSNGQIGDGTKQNSLLPKFIGTGYETVSATSTYSAAGRTDGSVCLWGNALGIQAATSSLESLVPVKVGGNLNIKFTNQAAGTSTRNIAALLADGPASRQTLRVVFTASNLPLDRALVYPISGGQYYIVALLPTGEIYNYTKSGWSATDLSSLGSFAERAGSIWEDLPPESIVTNLDLRSLVGTDLYGGISVGGNLFYNYIGSILPERESTPVSFPFNSGEWSVSRVLETSTGTTHCSISTAPLTNDGFFRIWFGWNKRGKTDPISMSMNLLGASTGQPVLGSHPGNSSLSVDGNSPFSLNNRTGGAFFVNPVTLQIGGPQRLYGNFEPNISRMMSGKSISILFSSTYGTTTYQVSSSLLGFSAAVSAFDFCVGSQ